MSYPTQYIMLHLAVICFLMFLLAVTISDFPWFWWPWSFWKVLVRYFVKQPSVRIWPMFFLWLACDDEEEDHRSKVSFSSYQFKGTYCQHNITINHLVEGVYVRFTYSSSQSLFILYSLERIYYAQPILK